MAKSKDSVQITAQSLDELKVQLQFILQRFVDRLDGIEGLRGDLESLGSGTFEGSISANSVVVNDDDGETIHSME